MKVDWPRRLKQQTDNWSTAPVVTFTIFSFDKRAAFWAFRQMAEARPLLWRVDGLRFYKLLGAGRGPVFSIRPDWNRYALLAVWDNPEPVQQFLAASSFMQRYRQRASKISSLTLRPVAAHGRWNGVEPFAPLDDNGAKDPAPLAVLTRASIRLLKLPAFWRRALAVSAELEGQPGLLASIGVGEAPFLRQATFSVWQNRATMQSFAYKTANHSKTIKLTRQQRWYREELFARFEIIAAEGEFFHMTDPDINDL